MGLLWWAGGEVGGKSFFVWIGMRVLDCEGGEGGGLVFGWRENFGHQPRLWFCVSKICHGWQLCSEKTKGLSLLQLLLKD